MKLIKTLTLCTLLSLWGLSSVLAQTVYKEEVRGVWITNVDSDVMFSKQKLSEAMDYLAAQGFNVIYPVVWNKGYTLHPSEVMVEYFGEEYKQDLLFASQGRDPLAEIIIEAHKHGIEVIPWFEFGFASSFSQNGGHIVQAYPNWASKDINGNIVVKNGFDWLNAIHHEVQDFMIELILEVVDKYDIDGIQGDDRLPAMAAEAGYSDYTVALYRSEHNGQSPPNFYGESDFMGWKADKLTSFLGRLYRSVKSRGEHYTVSMSPSIFDFSYREYLQDWPTWLDSGYVDLIHPQAYRYDISSYKLLINGMVGPEPGAPVGIVKPEDRKKLSPGIIILAGGRTNNASYVRSAIRFNREYGINGEVFFFYEGLRERNENLGDVIGEEFYDEPALLPNREGMIWRPKMAYTNETDPDVAIEGVWQINNTPEGFEGRSLQAQAGSNASLTYFIDVPYDAHYNAMVYVPFSSQGTGDMYVEFYSDTDTVSARYNQRVQAQAGWNIINNVPLKAGFRPLFKVIADSSSDSRPVYADAVGLVLDRTQSPDLEIRAVTVNAEDVPVDLEQPRQIQVVQSYPNPFNPSTTLEIILSSPSNVNMEIFSIAGQKVATLLNGKRLSAGTHKHTFNAESLASGIYLVVLTTNESTYIHRITLIK